jgi:hypothetical protein
VLKENLQTPVVLYEPVRIETSVRLKSTETVQQKPVVACKEKPKAITSPDIENHSWNQLPR